MKHNVLIFPAGSEIGLEIYASLKYSHHIDVFGASGKADHAAFIYPSDHYIEDSQLYVDSPGFLDRLNAYLVRLKITFIYPTHDTIALFLAKHSDQLAAKVIGSGFETNRIARSKTLTYQQFANFDFCPEVFDLSHSSLVYPVFLKPDQGQGGKGASKADSADELRFYLDRCPESLITEYLPGDELSVDCFTDFQRRLLFIGPRTRERVQMGISFRSAGVTLTDEINRIAHCINDTLLLNGAWFFQVKRDRHGRYKLMEFAPRQSSTMGLYRHAGINFALLSFFNARHMPVKILRNSYPLVLDRCLHNRFKATFSYETVYIDFDETIIEGDRVHDRVMAFIYQCRNQNKRLVLLTKHRHDVYETLREFGISEHLFAEIIHLSENQEKWLHIEPEGAIFIDNYWHDRHEVHEKLGIPVFDVDAVECLLI